MTIKGKLTAGFGILLLLFIFFSILVLANMASVKEQFSFVVEHDAPVIANANRLLKLVIDMETGQRGFCITQKEEFLEPYNSGRDTFNELMATEKALVSGNLSQVKTLERIEGLVEQWHEKAAEPEITMAREVATKTETNEYTDSVKRLAALLEAGTGKNLIDKVRGEFRNFIELEEKLTSQRYAAASKTTLNTIKVTLLLVLFSIILGSTIAIRSIRAIINPLDRLLNGTEIIGSGNLDHRIEIKSKDEIGQLTVAFNRMVDNLQQSERRVNNEISEHKKTEKQREELFKILQFKNRQLQDIVYAASHDLKAPLVNIQGFSNVLSNDCENAIKLFSEHLAGIDRSEQIGELIKNDIPESLRFITSSTKKMTSLLDGLLQVSRDGAVEIQNEPIDVNDIVRDTLNAMEHQIKESNITVTVDSLARCTGDTHMLDRVFTNLISNAIKYRDPSKEGFIKISGKIEDGMSIYCVQDNGVGIASSDQKKVFEIFKRVNPEDSISGEGLGLTIVTRIMDRLGGRIWLESEPGKGSKFFIALSTT